MTVPGEAPALTLMAPDATARSRRHLPGGGGWIRPVLAGLGAFLVIFGLLLRFYAAPRLIAAPAGRPGPGRGQAQPQAAAAAHQPPGGGEQAQPQTFGFPGAGRAVEGEQLRPGQ